MKSENRLAELTAFENVLDTFGGNPARWPANKRERLMSLAASDAEAQRLLREAKALDSVLAHAAGPPVGDTKALADRIAAAIANTSPGQSVHAERQSGGSQLSTESTSGVVIAWPRTGGEKQRAADAHAAALAGSVPRRHRVTSGWRAAALLAASLVAGIFVGVADLIPDEVTQIVASATTGTESPQSIAFLSGEGLLEIIEEEFL